MIVKLEEKTYRVVDFSQSYRRKKSGEKLLNCYSYSVCLLNPIGNILFVFGTY